MADNKKGKTKKVVPQKSKLSTAVQSLVRYVYDEATNALTTTVNAKITANGITTPLGLLTIGQIEKGAAILADMFNLFQKKATANKHSRLETLSSEFYTAVPHRIGRTRTAVEAAVIDSLENFEQKQDTLQLMKDMLQVNGEQGNLLFNAQVDDEYKALKCEMVVVEPKSDEFKEIKDYVEARQIRETNVRVMSVFKLQRPGEAKAYQSSVGNERHLFHGSRIQNWVGILSRGILMPKIATSMGVNRTDAGWLGNGIYFGDAACTSSFYTTPGQKKTRLITIAKVALGKQKLYHKITYGPDSPPKGFDSCHGVRAQKGVASLFDDDEYVIYDNQQQRLDYLVEFTS